MNKKLKSIYNGWSNLIFQDEKMKPIAEERAKICAGCKKNILNVCSLCLCPVPAKTMSEYESCDLNKWLR